MMILKSVRLSNIRSYRSQRIDFPEGSVLLAGDIGSGKSSILQAVEFALFGARRDSISGDALLRKGMQEGDVELDFMIGKSSVTVGRKLRRQQGSVVQDSGHIIIDGKRYDATATELKAKVLALLGYPRDLLTKSKSMIYRYTVYTPQEEMKQIILESYEQRIDTLRKVFGIDRYKRIAENATLYIRKLKESKRELVGIMQGLEEKRKELSAKKKELELAEESRKKLLPALDMVVQKKAAAKAVLAETEKKLRDIAEVRKNVDILDARLVEIIRARTRNNDDMKQLDAQMVHLKRLLENAFLEEKSFPQIKDIEDGIAMLQKQAQDSISRKSGLTERKSQLMTRMDELKKDIDSKSGRLKVSGQKQALYAELLEQLKDKDVVSKELDSLSRKLRGLDTLKTELSAGMRGSEQLKSKILLIDTCPTCRQLVSEVHKQSIVQEEDRKLKKISAELEGIEKERKAIESGIKNHSGRLEALAEKERILAATKVELNNLEIIRKELDDSISQSSVLGRELADIISHLEKLDDSIISSINSQLEQKRLLLKELNEHNLLIKERKHNLSLLAEKQQRIESIASAQDMLKQEVIGINRSKEALSATLTDVHAFEEQLENNKAGLEKISDEEKNLEVLLGEKGKEIEGIINIMKSIRKDVEEKEIAKETYDRFNAVQEWLERMFVSLMSAMERQIMAKVHLQFSELFASWFSVLVEDENISVRIDETFTPQVLQSGYDTSIDHLSGGERTAIALAYRLALNKVINDVMSSIRTRDIIILDEPTDGFSGEQLDRVREVLDQLNTKQTIIVSHEPKIESFVDHVIRIHKSEHVSRVVS